jgi:kynureninase
MFEIIMTRATFWANANPLTVPSSYQTVTVAQTFLSGRTSIMDMASLRTVAEQDLADNVMTTATINCAEVVAVVELPEDS